MDELEANRLATVSGWGQSGVRPIAALMWLAVLLGHAVAPSLRGIAVGYDAFTNRAGFVADGLAILLLLGLVMLGLIQAVSLIGSRAPIALRVPALLLGSLVMLVAVAAPSMPRPAFPLLLASCCTASALSLLVGANFLRQRSTLAFGAAALLAGLATFVRLAAVLVADRAASQPRSDGPELARVLATVAFGLEVLIVVVAAVWIAARSRRVALPMVVGALVASLLAARFVVADGSNTHTFAVILRIGARSLLTRPVPLLPYYAEVFVVVLATLLSLSALLLRSQVGAWAGALAIMLLVRGAAEIPLHAAALGVACMGMLLAAHDKRALYSALLSREAARGPASGR